MAGVREEVFGRSAPRASPASDVAALLAKLERECGWTLKAVGPDEVKPFEIPGRTTSNWDRGGIGHSLWDELCDRKAEIKAHVLAQGEGARDGT